MHHVELLVLLGLFIGAKAEVTLEDLREALNTAEISWLKKRTYDVQGHKCVYTKKIKFTEDSYEFEQGYEKGGQKQVHRLYSKLGTDPSEGPYMEVSSFPEATSGLKYFLKFWSKEEKCGILKVHKSGQEQYEMHIWESKVKEENTVCKNKYETLSSGKSSYDVYSTSCKSPAKEN